MRNILGGILLGLTIVGAWYFYPDLSAVFKPTSTEVVSVKETPVRNVVRKKIMFPPERIQSPAGPEGLIPFDVEVAVPPLETGATEAVKRTEHYEPGEEGLWQKLLRRPLNPDYVSGYPYRECFEKSAEANELPLALIVGLAGYFSNFDPESSMDNKWGIMHLDRMRRELARKDEFVNEPCHDIETACRYLARLLSESRGMLVPALIAYRDQRGSVHPDKIEGEGLLFSARLRRHVEKIYGGPYEKVSLYPFRTFDSLSTARRFMDSIQRSSRVDLRLGRENYDYVVYIPARDERAKNDIANLIKEKAGITGD